MNKLSKLLLLVIGTITLFLTSAFILFSDRQADFEVAEIDPSATVNLTDIEYRDGVATCKLSSRLPDFEKTDSTLFFIGHTIKLKNGVDSIRYGLSNNGLRLQLWQEGVCTDSASSPLKMKDLTDLSAYIEADILSTQTGHLEIKVRLRETPKPLGPLFEIAELNYHSDRQLADLSNATVGVFTQTFAGKTSLYTLAHSEFMLWNNWNSVD